MSDRYSPPLRPQPPVRVRRRTNPWVMVGGVVVLAIVATGLALAVLGGGGGRPTSSASSSASSDPEGSASGSASPTTAATGPTASAAPSVPPTAGDFAADDVVRITVDALTLRDAAGLGGEALWRLPAGTLGFVIGGPVAADGYAWYQMSGMGLPWGSGCVTPEPGGLLECPAWLGWAAAGDRDGTAWLEPGEFTGCREGPHDAVTLSEQPFTARLICFDDEDLTFVAWWPEIPADAGLGGACPAEASDVGWLVCQNINYDVLAGDMSEPFSPGGRLPVSIDPASGLEMPARGQWIEVTGHFDDPAARSCGDVAEAMSTDAGTLVFECRLQFVLTAVGPAPSQ